MEADHPVLLSDMGLNEKDMPLLIFSRLFNRVFSDYT